MADHVNEEARAWLEQHWDPALSVRQWWKLAAEAGWLFPSWPTGLGGRDLSVGDARRVAAAFVALGALGPPAGLGQVMGAPVVLRHGSDEQRRRFVGPLSQGLESWCQFFSEPEAGSDLAGLRTTAVRDGDEWIVSGQKVWTSGARSADRGMLVARTNWDVPKHRGLSYFVIDVHQPGIEIRPLRQMNGAAHFNEVFFEQARVPAADMLGEPGDGWAATVSTLAFERQGLAGRVGGLSSATPGERGGMLDRPAGEVIAAGGSRSMERESPQARGERWMSAGSMRRLAREQATRPDAVRRQELSRLTALSDAIGWTLQRAQAMGRRTGAPGAPGAPGVEANLGKLGRSDVGRGAQHLAPELVGPYAMLSGDDGPDRGGLAAMVLTVPAMSIAGGSDQVQRNIIGERGLGLPKEPSPDNEVPFRDVRRSG